MPGCRYCGEPAGFLRLWHGACRRRHAEALGQIPAFFPRALRSDMPASGFGNLARQIARGAFVTSAELRRGVEEGLRRLIAEAAVARDLTPERLARIYEIAAEFEFTPEDVTRLAARGGRGSGDPVAEPRAGLLSRLSHRLSPPWLRRKGLVRR